MGNVCEIVYGFMEDWLFVLILILCTEFLMFLLIDECR